jgi:CRP-like cAMP-binding protein
VYYYPEISEALGCPSACCPRFFCVDSTSGTFNLSNRCSSTGLVRDPSSQRLGKRVCEYDDTIFSEALSGSEACPLERRKTAKGERSTCRTSRANGTGRSISTNPALTRSEGSHLSPLFAGISQLVSAVFNIRSGGEIFGDGEDAQFVYKLVTGTVRVCKILSDGQRHISCFHFPGHVFGLERTATHRMSAEAIEDSRVLMFRRSQVERLIAGDLTAAHQMSEIFSGKLNDAEVHIFRLGRQKALQRVAAFLLETEGRLGRRGSLELPMSRRDIADYLGLSIEVVSRAFSQLQERHAIDRIESRRLILDQTTINAMVEN